jgi:uncharacterized membrane protein YbaN (DUF454 family)
MAVPGYAISRLLAELLIPVSRCGHIRCSRQRFHAAINRTLSKKIVAIYSSKKQVAKKNKMCALSEIAVGLVIGWLIVS